MSSRKLLIIPSAVLFAILPLFSCSIKPRTPEYMAQRPLFSEDQLYTGLVAAADSADFGFVLEKAETLINTYPNFNKIDAVYYFAAYAALALEDSEDAARFASMVSEKYPQSRFREKALLIEAQARLELGEYKKCAQLSVRLLNSTSDRETSGKAYKLQNMAVKHLRPGEAKTILSGPAPPASEGDPSFERARREFARGNYSEAYDILADLIYENPQRNNAEKVRRLLEAAASKRTLGADRNDFVYPNKIGAVLPVTGQLSLAGRDFVKGLTMAVHEFNDSSLFDVSLVTADSKGNPISAAKAADKLIHTEGVLAITGCVAEMPTITAAILANEWGVPFLSSVIDNAQLADIGRWVFRTRIPGEIEVTSISALAVDQLLLERFAVLAPFSGEKRRLADFFIEEINRLGGEIVKAAFFEPGATDFKDQLESIGEAGPEAIFIPASPAELVSLLPQIRFYDLDLQLLGMSDWDSDKLLRITGKELEGALFPSPAYHGENRAAFDYFLQINGQKPDQETSPFTMAGYFGMRLLLDGISRGASDREQVRDYLEYSLEGDWRKRKDEAIALTILTVHNGRALEFMPGSRNRE